jgi:hypothetical protein
MSWRRWLRVACLAGLACTVRPAVACSVDDSYRVPTNLELVQEADTILLGVVESGPTDIEGIDDPGLVIRPTLLLKGQDLPQVLHLPGMLALPRLAFPSDPEELQHPHPASGIGACIRYMFVQGSTVLFFLTEQDGRLMPLGYPFARWAEDVPSAESRWMRAVRLYVAISALPPTERQAALIAQRDALAAIGDADARAIAEDLERQLRPNRPWNEIMDEQVYDSRRGDGASPD